MKNTNRLNHIGKFQVDHNMQSLDDYGDWDIDVSITKVEIRKAIDEYDELKSLSYIIMNEANKVLASDLEEELGMSDQKLDHLTEAINRLNGNVEKFGERLSAIERDVAVLNERTQRVPSLPDEDRIRRVVAEETKDRPDTNSVKVIVSEALIERDLPTKDYVGKRIYGLYITIILFAIGTGISLWNIILRLSS